MNENERIIQLLKEKLEWYTYKATAEEFEPGVIAAIVKLLELLEPLPEGSTITPDESLSRFAEKYKKCSYRARRRKGHLIRILAVCAAFLLLFLIGINAGVYATSKVGFFEFISQSQNEWEFYITGEPETEYTSLDKLPKDVRESIIFQEMPADLDLEKIVLLETEEGFHISMFCTLSGSGESLRISIDHPAADMPDAEYIGDINGVSVYSLQNAFCFRSGGCSYNVSAGIDEETLLGIVHDLLLSAYGLLL